MSDVFNELAKVIEQRRTADPKSSYVASLCHSGTDKILKKLGEETIETIIAAAGGQREQVIYETADLWFHSLVLLKFLEIEPDEVMSELERRFGRSGLEEKAARAGKVS